MNSWYSFNLLDKAIGILETADGKTILAFFGGVMVGAYFLDKRKKEESMTQKEYADYIALKTAREVERRIKHE